MTITGGGYLTILGGPPDQPAISVSRNGKLIIDTPTNIIQGGNEGGDAIDVSGAGSVTSRPEPVARCATRAAYPNSRKLRGISRAASGV